MTDHFKESIEITKNKIENLKSALDSKKLDEICTEYDKLAQLQLDYSRFLKNNWESSRKEAKADLKIDIENRQAEFDKELQAQEDERRRKWILKKPTKKERITLCNQLLEVLKDERKLEIVNTSSFDIDTSVLILPTRMLESFWSLDIDPPAMKSEIDLTVKLLLETKSKLESV